MPLQPLHLSRAIQRNARHTKVIDHRAEKIDQKSRILSEGEARAKRIEMAAENQIKAEKANSNWRFLSPQGDIVLDIPWWREEEIRHKAKSHADHVRQTAQSSANNVY